MNKKQLKQYIDNPTLLSSSDTRKLSLLLDDYPYFQTARLLFAKGLKINNEEKFEQLLQVTATYAVNRKKMCDLLASESVEGCVVKEEQQTSKQESVQHVEENHAEIIEPVISQETEVVQNSDSKEEQIETTTQENQEQLTAEEQNDVVQDIENKQNIESVAEKTDTDEIVENHQETIEPVIAQTSVEETQENVTDVEQQQEEVEPIAAEENIVQEIETQPLVSEQIEGSVDEEQVVEVEQTNQEVSDNQQETENQDIQCIEKQEETTQTESLADQILKKYRAMKEQATNVVTDVSTQVVQEKEETTQRVEEQHDEVQSIVEVKEVENRQEESQPIAEIEVLTDLQQSSEQEVVTDSELTKTDSDINQEVVEQTNEQSVLSFDISDNEETIDQSEENPESEEIESPSVTLDFEETVADTAEPVEKHDWYERSEKANHSHSMDLIDSFIGLNYKTPLKTESTESEVEIDDSNNDFLKAGIEEHEIITEAMAKMYVKQQLFAKAIDIYEKLSLKYPQKSIYFADRIKEVNELKK